MNIQRHYHVGEVLQRSLVTYNNILYRRIANYVNIFGELSGAPETAVWQECIYCGEFQNVVGSFAVELEKLFITALINANTRL